MFIAILTLLSALSISGVAIFYSVIGLATIFPGAFWPVVIMGSVLEVGKLVTASWLYRNWKYTRFLLKTYLTIAVVVLSLITSMGIFGFLSKAHLEQNLAEDTVTQRIEVINNKISSQETYIKRQQLAIDRFEKSLSITTNSNTDAIEIEKQSMNDVQDKFKVLLTVETNAVKELNDRMKSLDKDVSDVLTSNKSFFNEEKAAAELKASQKDERALINKQIAEAQNRISVLKEDYAKDTAIIQSRIDKLREGNTDDKTGVTAQISQAEANILSAQNTIDDLIVQREPLEAKMIKLEAEVGPVKYIASLVVDWGVTDSVDTSEAVRWVILVIIFVFDPLAVLLLVAANQSLLRRFPVKAPKPDTIVDLEKPDDEDVTLKWNEMMAKANAQAKMEQATTQLQEWKQKLDAFNTKVPKPDHKPVEIIQDKESNDSDWGDGIVIPEKKTEDKEIVADNMTDGFDPDEVEGYEEFNSKYDTERTKPDLTEVVEPEVAVKEPEATTVEEALKMPEKESVQKPIQKKSNFGMIGVRPVDDKGKVVEPPKPRKPNPGEMTEFERTGMLNKLHQQHGKFEDISDEELKKERDQSNRAQYLADVSLTKEEAEQQSPITESRMAFFQDMIDDILRGDLTFENVPEENRKIIAQIMDPELPNPQIITKGSALKEQTEEGIEKMTTEGLKEKFMAQPQTEERPMTDEELDELLAGWEDEQPSTGKTKMVIKDGKRIFVPVEEKEPEYIQNEEQDETTMWNKTQELDIPEPEKNELDLPPLENTIEEDAIPEMAEEIKIQQVIPKDKFDKYKTRVTTDEDYRQRIENRINDLITKVESGETKLEDLTEEDQKVILDILNQNG
tara:strand:- start:2486 stop:5029 length:2544 start_codon:yes stop_codon:yes gene_type:complete